MKIKHFFALFFGLLLVTSCSAPKDIVYFQNIGNGSTIDVSLPYQIKVQPGDKLRVLVNTQDQRLTQMFNLTTVGITNSYNQRNQIGYTVDSNGNIDFPLVGTCHVAGLTRQEVADEIKKSLQENDLIKDPVIIVDYLNMGVTVMGDVKNPGHYTIENDRYTILEALSEAGDLNITAQRNNVKVIRQEVGRQTVYEINLLNADSVYRSPAFFLQQNDVVYVTPNDKKKRESEINGNTLYTYGFWLTMLSFLMSVAVFIKK